MKRGNLNYTLVGLAFIGAVALSIVVLFQITGKGFATVSYFVTYRNVAGLNYGTPVFYEGYRIGQVDKIVPVRREGKTAYRVALSVRKDWPIPVDSVAQMASSGLLADVSIAIKEGAQSIFLKAGATMQGRESSDVFAAINDLSAEITQLTRTKIAPMVGMLSKRMDSLTQVLDAQAPLILQDVHLLLTRLNKASLAMNDVLNERNRENIAATLSNINALSAQLAQTRAELDQVLGQLKGIAVENRPMIRDAVQDLSQITASLARRMESISYNLEASSRHFNEFTREIRKHPNRLLFTPEADDVVVKEKEDGKR